MLRRDKLGLTLLTIVSLTLAVVARELTSDQRKTLLEDFRKADIPRQLELLPRLTEAIPEAELPPEARYLMALQLLRPHLTWHAPNLIIPDKTKVRELREQRKSGERWRWSEALGAETWMFAEVPAEVRDTVRQALEAWKQATDREGPKPAEPGQLAWRLKDPQHADIVRAVRLLSGLQEGELGQSARHWVEEIGRNNTVLTLDVTGSYGAGKAAPVVLDVRNVSRVKCQLFRVRRPEDLLWVTNRIGTDFIYRDHGLQYDQKDHEEKAWLQEREGKGSRNQEKEVNARPPAALTRDPVWEFESPVSDLKSVGSHWRRRLRWDEDIEYRAGDGDFFGDACKRYSERLSKSYRPGFGQWSSWQCDRILEVPGKAVAEAGAYVLAVAANGQTAYAPLVVEPLSLTLRRCRDGVFVAVADSEAKKPVAGASVHGRDMLGSAATDAEGIAFAKLYGGGERAVIVHKDGQFAIGGFGRVFEGIYYSPLDIFDRLARFHKLAQAKSRSERDGQAQVYADRHVIAAFTDRPTYRPGQEVQFKVIVRRLAPERAEPGDRARAFRAEDFEFASRLEVPPTGTRAPFALLDSKGRAVADGELTLNEFGTASGKVQLSGEAALGNYAFRVRLAGIDRVVPEVCAVAYYRLPSFGLDVTGVPEKVNQAEPLRVELAGAYFFGKPLAGGRVEVRLTPTGTLRPLASAEATLDAAGKGVVQLHPGRDLAAGRYVVRCDLSDEGGRSVHRVLPYTVEEKQRPRTGLGALPRFVPQDKPLVFPTSADVVVAEQVRLEGKEQGVKIVRFGPRDGKVEVRFPTPGWYTLTAGTDQADVFAFGGKDHPCTTRSKRQDDLIRKVEQAGEDGADTAIRGWVDLTNDAADPYLNSPFDRRDSHLLALFDRQEAKVGDALRVLTYIPGSKVRLLFTMEGFTVLDYLTVNSEGSNGHYRVLDIPIKRRYLPHFYLRGRVLGGEDISWHFHLDLTERRREKDRQDDEGTNPSWCRIDVTDPQALPGGEKLQVEMKPARLDYKPGDSVAVQVRVLDRTGKPAAAEVALAAVDASVYTFGEDRLRSLAALFDDPHPQQQFYVKGWRSSLGKRWAILKQLGQNQDHAVKRLEELMRQQREESEASSLADTRSALAGPAPEPPVQQGQLPVASIPLARLRADFRETAAWLPQLRTDANGELRTSFKLPDTLTRYRISAVALTKETEIGTARAEVRAALPLAVQLLLPRFAVEGDRLAAVGVVHNNGLRDRVCAVTWQVEGATIDGQLSENALANWQHEGGSGSGRLTVPAGKSARVGLWLKCDRLGTAKVSCRCTDGEDGDAEERTLPVQPLGRERTLSFDGAFTDSTQVKLPAGFSARDVRVVVSRNDVARSLDGIAGLVDYPYGCVEQSMSRFLPAVLVQQASQRTRFSLPADVAAKLPGVLEQGLTRLYRFQHADGGWGWWEHDKTDERMTVYVVYGLARCAGAKVRVDAGVLARGAAWVKTAFRDGALTGTLAARAWLALAHAGHADATALRPFAEQLLAGDKSSAEARCLTALACKSAGLEDVAARLWARTRDWQPEADEEIALLLKAQVTFGEPLAACQRSAGRLMKLRTGLGWGSTQATAAALDALSLLIALSGKDSAAKSLRVKIVGAEALNLLKPKDGDEVFRAHLTGDRLARQDPAEFELVNEGGGSLYYTVEAVGTQRQDKVEPIGDAIKVSRTFETVAGQPLAGPVPLGQTVAVRLRVVLEKPFGYVLIEDRRPAGCEFADDHLHGKNAAGLATMEFRDDRVCAFASSLPAGRHEFVYYLRAETPGVSQVLPGCVYPMYQDRVRGETGAARLEVEPARRERR
jgi:hypothetical protein